MVNKKTSSKKIKKVHTFRFSFGSLLLLFLGLLFMFGWVFSLGIIVGKGFLPDTLDAILSFKKKAVKVEKKEKTDHQVPIKEEELSFYNQLVDKKGRAKKRVASPHLSEIHDTAIKKKEIETVKQDTHIYSVQVAAFKDKGKTEKMVARLTRLGYRAYYSHAVVKGEMFYRVRCGPFPSLEEAKKNAKRLTDKEGFKPFMVYHDKKQ